MANYRDASPKILHRRSPESTDEVLKARTAQALRAFLCPIPTVPSIPLTNINPLPASPVQNYPHHPALRNSHSTRKEPHHVQTHNRYYLHSSDPRRPRRNRLFILWIILRRNIPHQGILISLQFFPKAIPFRLCHAESRS